MTQDKRRLPRDRFDTEVTVGVAGPPVHHRILDVSPGGIAILSDRKFAPGTRLMIRYVKDNSAEVTVIDSDVVETDPDFLDYTYRVRTRFVSETVGRTVFEIFRRTE